MENNYVSSLQEQFSFLNAAGTRDVIVGGIYQHYKKKNYKVIAVAVNTEDIQQKVVVYEALYDNQVAKVWVRPLEMFLELIEHEGQLIPRFSLVNSY